jgi:molybdopterin synthase catalytic subunit
MNNSQVQVSVQEADFDCGQLQRALLGSQAEEGAVATFTGYVRGKNRSGDIDWMELEHYPGMTEKSLETIAEEALSRWSVQALSIVHRIGRLQPGAQIVWVGVASAHRGDAFAACEFIMDYLKTRAPFWKKEQGEQGSNWVAADGADTTRAGRWK